MTDPDGPLTAAQFEILEVIWEVGNSGATVAEIWHVIESHRGITRTTVLNQVDRLEKRGWLTRTKTEDGFRYFAIRSRDQVAQGLISEFVNSFFGGSASNLVMSLFGSKKLKPAEIARLKKILEERTNFKKTDS